MPTSSSAVTLWRLTHGNGQTARCAMAFRRDRWAVGRWINDFVAGIEEFTDRAQALQRADELRQGLELRGFREDE